MTYEFDLGEFSGRGRGLIGWSEDAFLLSNRC